MSRQLILNNIVIESRESDNFVNATQMCKAGGKKFQDWSRLESTKEFLKELEITLKNEAGITASSESSKIQSSSKDQEVKIKIIDIKKGGNVKKQGSWIHPDAAINLAQWISGKFSVQVSRWIRELLITGSVLIDSKKTDKDLVELVKQLKESKEQLQIKDQQIKKIEEEKLWINNHAKNRLTFEKNTIKTDGTYLGSNHIDGKNFLKKIGKAVDSKDREKSLAASGSFEGGFKIDNFYPVYKGYELVAEKIVHTVLSPLNVHIEKGKSGSTEVFVVHTEHANQILSETANFLNRMAEWQNNYLDLLAENSYVYPLVNTESILSIEYTERKSIEAASIIQEDINEEPSIEESSVKKMLICHFDPNNLHEAPKDKFEIYESGGRYKNCLDCRFGKLNKLKEDITSHFVNTCREFSPEETEKIITITNELKLITLEDIHGKHQISQTLSYKRCGCKHHINNEFDRWLSKDNFTASSIKCKPCDAMLRKEVKQRKQLKNKK